MNKLKRAAKQAATLSVVLGILICYSVYLFGYLSFALGLMFGILGGIGYFFLLGWQLDRVRDSETREAVAEIQSGWVERGGYIAALCLLGYFIPGLHFAGVLIGLLSQHLVIFIWGLIVYLRNSADEL